MLKDIIKHRVRKLLIDMILYDFDVDQNTVKSKLNILDNVVNIIFDTLEAREKLERKLRKDLEQILREANIK